jgi:biotin-(acetyl-CoA carboxylase) ligase
VERRDSALVVGFGLNLWWPQAPEGMGALYGQDPGPERHAEIGGLWAAELMRLIEGEGWPREEYRRLCSTLARKVSWEPDGLGRAVDVAEDGALLVEVDGEIRSVYSGEVRHLRS